MPCMHVPRVSTEQYIFILSRGILYFDMFWFDSLHYMFYVVCACVRFCLFVVCMIGRQMRFEAPEPTPRPAIEEEEAKLLVMRTG